jgi:hypothetical protein
MSICSVVLQRHQMKSRSSRAIPLESVVPNPGCDLTALVWLRVRGWWVDVHCALPPSHVQAVLVQTSRQHARMSSAFRAGSIWWVDCFESVVTRLVIGSPSMAPKSCGTGSVTRPAKDSTHDAEQHQTKPSKLSAKSCLYQSSCSCRLPHIKTRPRPAPNGHRP